MPMVFSASEGPASADARTSAPGLARRVAPVPVRLVDERFTTVIAHDALRRGGRDSPAPRPREDPGAAARVVAGGRGTGRSTRRPPGGPASPAPAGPPMAPAEGAGTV